MPGNLLHRSVLALLFATVPAVAQPVNVSSDEYANIHTLGIVSALGNTVELMNIGTTIFGNSSNMYRSDFDLDQKMPQLLSDAFKGRFVAVSIPADPDHVRDLVKKSEPVSVNDQVRDLFTKSEPVSVELTGYLRSLPSAGSVDALVAVIPAKSRVNNFAHPIPLFGFGVTHASNPFVTTKTSYLFATYYIVVIDAKSGKTISWSYAAPANDALHVGFISGACSTASIWSEKADTLSPDQKRTIRDELTRLVLAGLPYALKMVNLPSEVEPSGALPVRPSICTLQ
jgi:hypothetical protein